jgi:hypothetical protein
VAVAGVLDVEAGVLEVDDGLDEHPTISAASTAATAHDPTSFAMCVAPLQSRTDARSIFRKASWRERTSSFFAVKILINEAA